MTARRDVLKYIAGTLISSVGGSLLTTGCSAGLATLRTKIEHNTIIISKIEAQQLSAPNGILLIYAAGLTTPIILRSVEGHGVVALSLNCTHRGCEVRPFPDSFECPCHGSEFNTLGEVLAGPARKSLKKFKVVENTSSWTIKIS